MTAVDDALDRIKARAREQAGGPADDNVWNVLARDVLYLCDELQRLRDQRDEWEKIAENRAEHAHQRAVELGMSRKGRQEERDRAEAAEERVRQLEDGLREIVQEYDSATNQRAQADATYQMQKIARTLLAADSPPENTQ